MGYICQPGPRLGAIFCAQIGPTSANNNKANNSNNNQRQQQRPLGLTGLLFAGARLSGVSLINPGAGPGAGPCPCRRPSVVTEGYIRLPPLPPTGSAHLTVPDSGSPPVHPHDYRCNLQCILRVVFKKHRFLQGFVAFAVSGFHLGDVKKPWVFHGFGS